jgi:hypothetical protein
LKDCQIGLKEKKDVAFAVFTVFLTDPKVMTLGTAEMARLTNLQTKNNLTVFGLFLEGL